MTAGTAVWAQVHRLVVALRARGVDVGISELVDATDALEVIDIGLRADLRTALSCTLIKRPDHAAIFIELFDRYFPRVHRHATADAAAALGGAAGHAQAAPLEDRIAEGLDNGEIDALRRLAAEAVAEHGGFEDEVRGERYHVYRTLRAVDLAALLTAALARARAAGAPLGRAEVEARIEAMRRLITEAVRAELAARVVGHDVDGSVASPFDIELARANARELEEMRAAVRPLARRLAARLRRRRASRRQGRVDLRSTARHSLQSGGVPLDLAYRRRHANRPEVFLLCDLSGSVADFASFTLTFMTALAYELTKTRSFAFVDAIDEITALVEASPNSLEPWQLLQHGKVIGADGHSDYGTVLASFWDSYGRTGLTDRSTVIIVGDARGNYRPARAEVLGEIAARTRAVYWLNPEPRAEWDTTDSQMSAYAPHCRATFEVRTLGQLADAAAQIL